MTTLDTHNDQLRAEALEQLRKRSEFWAHLAAYLLVNTFLIAIWFIAGAGFFWPMFPLFRLGHRAVHPRLGRLPTPAIGGTDPPRDRAPAHGKVTTSADVTVT